MTVVGLLAGLLWHKSNRLDRWVIAIGGFLITMVFDIGTSMADAVLFHYPVWVAMAGLYASFISIRMCGRINYSLSREAWCARV